MIKYLYAKFFDKLRGTAIKNSHIDKTSFIGSGCNILDVKMKRHSYCSHDTQVVCCDIGSFCSISDHVYIGGAEHPMEWGSTSPLFQKNMSYGWPTNCIAEHELPPLKRTFIGNDVWIGHGATIKQGVKIGDGAVVGANALVTKDVPPYAIVGGVPAKVIRFRFNDEMIKALLQTEWWELSDEVISKYAHLIKTPDLYLKGLINHQQNII